MAATLRDIARERLPLRVQLRADGALRRAGQVLVPGEQVQLILHAGSSSPDQSLGGPGLVLLTDHRMCFVPEGWPRVGGGNTRHLAMARDEIPAIPAEASWITLTTQDAVVVLSDFRPPSGLADLAAALREERPVGAQRGPSLAELAQRHLGDALRDRLNGQLGELGLVLARDEPVVGVARAVDAERNREVLVALTGGRLLMVSAATLHFMRSPGTSEVQAIDRGMVQEIATVAGTLVVGTEERRLVLSDWQPDVAEQVRVSLDVGPARTPPATKRWSPPPPDVPDPGPPVSGGPMRELARDVVKRAREQVRSQLERLDERGRADPEPAPSAAAPAVEAPTASPPAPGESASAPERGPVLDVNTASEAELASLPGVGVPKAKRARSWRAQHGGFSSIEQFADILDLKPHQRVVIQERAVAIPLPPAEAAEGTTVARPRRKID